MVGKPNHVSIPLEQGNVFRLGGFEELNKLEGLNPFGTGQCLSTNQAVIKKAETLSQSLWNRAMSFDEFKFLILKTCKGLNPFGTGQCLSTAVGC